MVLNVPEMIPNGTTMQKDAKGVWCVMLIYHTNLYIHELGIPHSPNRYLGALPNGISTLITAIYSRRWEWKRILPFQTLESSSVAQICLDWFIFCCTALIMIMDDPGKEKTTVFHRWDFIGVCSTFWRSTSQQRSLVFQPTTFAPLRIEHGMVWFVCPHMYHFGTVK